MRRFVFYALLIGTLVFAAVLAGAFFIHALDVMSQSSRLSAVASARGALNPLADLGIAIGVMIASLGVLLVCYRYANRLPLSINEWARRGDRRERRERRNAVRPAEPQNGD